MAIYDSLGAKNVNRSVTAGAIRRRTLGNHGRAVPKRTAERTAYSRTRLHRADYPFFLIVAALVLFGLLMVLSAGSVQSFQLKGNGHFYFVQQLQALGIGLVGFYVAQKIHYSTWRKLAGPLLIVAVILLLAVFIPGVGFSYGGATRWVNLQVFLLQSSEVAKLALVVYLAAWLEKKGRDITDFRSGFLPVAGVIALLCGLIMLQPDMGSMSVVAAIGLTMFFTAGAAVKHLGIAAGGVLAAVALLIAAAPYRINRLLTFLDPTKDTLGTGYHVQQALVAIGSGGLFGLGFNNSLQKHYFLPEPMNDSIFAIIAEELGFFAGIAVIVVFAILAVRGLRIARNAPDTFSRLLVAGVVTWITVQAMVNIAAMLSIVPLTGVPLPFISLGGSALVVLMVALGIVLNISRYTVANRERTKEEGHERTRRRGRNRGTRRAGNRGLGRA